MDWLARFAVRDEPLGPRSPGTSLVWSAPGVPGRGDRRASGGPGWLLGSLRHFPRPVGSRRGGPPRALERVGGPPGARGGGATPAPGPLLGGLVLGESRSTQFGQPFRPS